MRYSRYISAYDGVVCHHLLAAAFLAFIYIRDVQNFR
jgi:hypothetical protein